MRASTCLIAPLFALLASCGGSGGSGTANPSDSDEGGLSPTTLSDGEILSRVYDPEYTVPHGFFVDARADTQGSYTVHHVLDASHSYELCTDDYQTAAGWEAADNESRAVRGVFVSAAETARYFEFVRELDYVSDVSNVSGPTSPGYARIFKCSNTNRDGVDRTLLNGYAGVINSRPVGANEIRDFTEYLWQFRFFPAGRVVVLDSVRSSAANDPQHTLQLAFRFGQGSGRCDRIEVADWRFRANRTTGDVGKTFETLRSFEARLVNGMPTPCE